MDRRPLRMTSAEAAAGELVQLYIYDLSGGMARTFSQMLLGRQVRGRKKMWDARSSPSAVGATPPPHPTAPCPLPPLCPADRGHLAHRGGGGRHGAFLWRRYQCCPRRRHTLWAPPAGSGSGVSSGPRPCFTPPSPMLLCSALFACSATACPLPTVSCQPCPACSLSTTPPLPPCSYTQLPEEVRAELLADLGERYTPEAYSLFHNNCNTFSNELAELLCGRGVPAHITGEPRCVAIFFVCFLFCSAEVENRRQQPTRPEPAPAGTSAGACCMGWS